jgi:hypothetical protein
MRKSVSGIAALAAAGVLLGAASASAQDLSLSGAERDARLAELEQVAIGNRPASMPAQAAAMNEALARQDYRALRALMAVTSSDEAYLMLNWSKVAVFKGASFPVSFFYATDLWGMAEAMERAAARDPSASADLLQRANTLKTTSAMMAIYTQALVRVDGERCGDMAASAKPLEDMAQGLAPQWAFARTLSSEEQARIGDQAFMIEEATSVVRGADFSLCDTERARMHLMATGQTVERADDPATPGRDVDVAIDPKALLVDNAVWWERVPFARDEAGRDVIDRLGFRRPE